MSYTIMKLSFLDYYSVWNVNSYRFISLLYRLRLTAWYSLVSDSFKSQKPYSNLFFLLWIRKIMYKDRAQGQEDGEASKGMWLQAWWPEFLKTHMVEEEDHNHKYNPQPRKLPSDLDTCTLAFICICTHKCAWTHTTLIKMFFKLPQSMVQS